MTVESSGREGEKNRKETWSTILSDLSRRNEDHLFDSGAFRDRERVGGESGRGTVTFSVRVSETK